MKIKNIHICECWINKEEYRWTIIFGDDINFEFKIEINNKEVKEIFWILKEKIKNYTDEIKKDIDLQNN